MIKKHIVKVVENFYNTKYALVKKRKINYLQEFKKIALILTSPLGLGDLIMMTPLIKSFRINFPNAKIDLITDKNIFENMKEVNKIILLKKSGIGLLSEFIKLKKNKYDLGVIMARSVNQSLYLDLLSPKYKIGFLGGYKILSNFKLKNKGLKFNKKEHFTINSLKIIKSLGMKEKYELIKPIFSKKTKNTVEKLYESLDIKKDKPNIGINAFASWETRMWDKKNYISLIEKLHSKFNFILYGGGDSVSLNKEIEKELLKKNIKINNVSNKMNISQSIYFLKFIDLFLTIDCGPMHFSFIMQRPTLALFGPVNPKCRLPLNYKKFKIYDSLWFNDFQKCSIYNYESKHVDKKLNGLKAIPLNIVREKILKFFKNRRFY